MKNIYSHIYSIYGFLDNHLKYIIINIKPAFFCNVGIKFALDVNIKTKNRFFRVCNSNREYIRYHRHR